MTVFPSESRIHRRTVIFGAAAFALQGRSVGAASRAIPRIAAIDWAAAETLVAIGIMPVAIADLEGFRASFSHLPAMDETIDLGSTWEPNLELLDRLKPDAIYLPSWSGLSRPQLEQIAPVLLCDIHGRGGDPIYSAKQFAKSVLVDFPGNSGENAIQQLEKRLARLRGAARRQPVFLLNLRSSNRFVNVYAAGSLPDSALTHVGLQNAWQEPVNGFGFASIGAEKLVQASDASIVILNQNDRTAEMLARLNDNIIWTAIPAVRASRIHISPPVSVFGGLVSAASFSEWLAATFDKAA
ncbi:hypothetical protein ACO34A_23290 (plasmid) [Rhizobium sp. ACO-34A]|nr:ABC transporter substrate-binding protein [Rhizobium sp. ACO-34A]ATN36715.1 hypothetical protein ACO34A_23290 [Rhizobium sp. ACO-34A]